MSKQPYPSQQAERIIVRLPDGMRDRLAEVARANKRSVNAEVVARLESSLGGVDPLPLIQIEIDSSGMPTSWAELHEHLAGIQKIGKISAAALQVTVVTPAMLSSQGREAEAESLFKRYKALTRAAKAAPEAAPKPKRKKKLSSD